MRRNTRRLLLAVGLLLASAACTSTRWGPTFDDPEGEMSLVGDLSSFCLSGRVFYFGNARNTGDVTLRDVEAIISVYNAAGGFIGSYRGLVSKSADVEEIKDEDGEVVEEVVTFDDVIKVDESGVFNIHSGAGCGSAARAEISFDFNAPFSEGV